MQQLDVIVIGAGHAGLAISYHLKDRSLSHVVFERGKIGETWRSQRWDSFKLNSANKKNSLPGYTYSGPDGDAFDSAISFANVLSDYAAKFQLPVREHARVVSVEKPDDHFTVTVDENGTMQTYRSANVVIASGNQNAKKVPPFAANISPAIMQLHTLEYRNAAQLPEGAVLVAGSAQTGCQIAEDLLDAGRKVYLASSMVGRLPRRYRGRDIIDWLSDLGFFLLLTSAVTDPKMLSARVPQLSGVGTRGKTVSLQSIARDGGTILGKIENADATTLYLQPNAAQHVQFADGFSKMAKDMIDGFIVKNQIDAPPAETDPNDEPDPSATCATNITQLNLAEHNITSIIWATGFDGDFSYLKVARDGNGQPKHTNGIGEVPGLYVLGFPWLRMRKSGMIFGIVDDAGFIAEQLLSSRPAK